MRVAQFGAGGGKGFGKLAAHGALVDHRHAVSSQGGPVNGGPFDEGQHALAGRAAQHGHGIGSGRQARSADEGKQLARRVAQVFHLVGLGGRGVQADQGGAGLEPIAIIEKNGSAAGRLARVRAFGTGSRLLGRQCHRRRVPFSGLALHRRRRKTSHHCISKQLKTLPRNRVFPWPAAAPVPAVSREKGQGSPRFAHPAFPSASCGRSSQMYMKAGRTSPANGWRVRAARRAPRAS